MATKKKDSKYPITLEVGEEVLGKFSSVGPLSESMRCAVELDYPGAMRGLGELWKNYHGPECSGKTNLGLSIIRKLLHPGHLYVKAQLEMWSVEKIKEVCVDCLTELVTTLEDMGYNVWFDQKSSLDEDLLEAHGVVVQDYKLEYVGRGEEGD